MSYEQTFEEQICQMQDERHHREHYEHKRKELNGEYIYLDFCVWCNANGRRNDKNNAKVFAMFLSQNNVTLNYGQKLHLATKYFGYKLNYSIEYVEKWLMQTSDNLTFWQKKEIAEKYFGYKYEYDYDKQDWEVKRV